jgi:hypothetical protein
MRQQPPASIFSGNNPLPGLNGIVVFVILGILGAVVDCLVCWTYLNFSNPSKNVIAEIFVVLLLIGWLAFSMAGNVESFIARGLTIVVLYSPLIAMTVIEISPLFWATLLAMVGIAVVTVLNEVETEEPWTKVITAIYAAWVVAGVFVTLGSSRLFGYAESAENLAEFHFLLDARYLITVILLLAAFGEALFNAFEAGLPKLPPSPKLPRLDDAHLSDSAVGMLMRPLFVFANLFIMIADALVTLVWQLIGYIVTYLYRTGKNLAHQFYALITNTKIVKAVGRVIGTFVVVLIYMWFLKAIAPDIVLYLVRTTSLFSLSSEILLAMIRLMFLAIFSIGSVLLLTHLWKAGRSALEQAAFGGSTIMVGLALSAALMYLIARTHLIEIVGFESIGILSLLLVLLLGSVFAYHVALLFTGKTRRTT